MLKGGARDVPQRHRTLLDAIGWSYDLLDEDEKKLFARLGVFAGSFTLGAVEAVGDAARELSQPVVEVLSSLLAKNLIQSRSADLDDEPRYAMLETIRGYAEERLEEGDESNGAEADKIRGWLLEYYLALARVSSLQMLGEGQHVWGPKLDAERGNIRATLRWAIEHGRIEGAARITVGLVPYFYIVGDTSEGRYWLERIADHEASATLPDGVRAHVLALTAHMATVQYDLEKAEHYLSEGLELLRHTGDQPRLAAMLTTAGAIETVRGDYTRAERLLRESLALFTELRNDHSSAIALHMLALVSLYKGDYEQVKSLQAEAISLFRQVGDKWHTGLALSILGQALCRSGQLAEAERVCAEACEVVAGLEWNNEALGLALTGKAEIAMYSGDYRRARTLYRESLMTEGETGSYPPIATNLLGLGLLEATEGCSERAATLFGALDGLSERLQAVFVTRGDRPRYERSLAAARASMGEEEWLLAWSRGRVMPVKEAVAFALSGE
jgi:tetratricopeptide (TPR) repeat protein